MVPSSKKVPTIGKKRGKIRKKREKIGKKREKIGKTQKTWEERQKSGRFFHIAPPDRFVSYGCRNTTVRNKFVLFDVRIVIRLFHLFRS